MFATKVPRSPTRFNLSSRPGPRDPTTSLQRSFAPTGDKDRRQERNVEHGHVDLTGPLPDPLPPVAPFPRLGPRLLQTKLRIGALNDPLEREADHVAEQVMRISLATPPSSAPRQLQRKCSDCSKEEREATAPASGQINRKCAHCQQEKDKLSTAEPLVSRKCAHCEEEEHALQTKPGISSRDADASPLVHQVLSSPGRPLADDDLAFFTPRFGFDFSRVRVHADHAAAESARSVNALAYASGSNIAFAAGQYQPGTETGRLLLAHELAHVVQQGGTTATVQRRVEPENPAEGAEHKDDAADVSIGNLELSQLTKEGPSGVLRRQPAESNEDGNEHVLTRPEEVRLSLSSPGGVAATGNPFGITLFNFTINSAELKPEHREVIAELSALIHLAGGIGSVQLYASGNADATGAPAVNTPLSRRRAIAVQGMLSRLSGAPIRATWYGEDNPVADNGTVEGRSRNRRVDIIFVPTKPEIRNKDVPEKDDDHQKDDTKKDKKKKDDKEPIIDGPPEGFCEAHPIICSCKDHPILCAILGLSLIALIFCILNPEVCLGWKLPCVWPFCREPRKPKEKDEPPEKHACITSSGISLPSGPQLVHVFENYLLQCEEFSMSLNFTEDPSTNCVCNCGEYRQKVRGFVERDGATGTMKPDPGIRVFGGVLDRDKWLEDSRPFGVRPYGHRYDDPTRLILLPNDDTYSKNDKFSPNRLDGCLYKGSDAPRTEAEISGETVRIHLEFRGGPVDACQTPEHEISGWHEWTVDGQLTRPPQPPPNPKPHVPRSPQGGGGTRGSGGSVTQIVPRPATNRPTRHSSGLQYAGGIPRNATCCNPYTLHLQFTRNGKIYDAPVPVKVIADDAATVTIQVVGPSMEISPEGSHNNIVTIPGATATIPRAILNR